MKQGDKVHIVSTVVPGVWNKPREMVFTFISDGVDGAGRPVYVFSARPEAGTQEMLKRHVDRMQVVAQGTPIMLPRIKR
jgi:hypothetical protein